MTIEEVPSATVRAQLDELRARVRHAQLAADVGLALTSTDAFPAQLQRCATAIVEHLDAAFARIWALDEPTQVLVLQASAGLYTHLDGDHGRVAVGQFKIGLIAAERQPHLTNDVQRDPRVSDIEWAVREGMVAFAGYPLLVGERLVGVAAMFARQPLSRATIEALASIGSQVAVAIDRERANAERESLRQLATDARAVADAERGRLRDLIMQAPALIAVLRGPQHVFELVNPRYEALVGQRATLGLSVTEALPELAAQGFISLLDRVYATGEPFIGQELPARLAVPGGGTTEAFFNFVYQPSHGPDGEIDGILVFAVEVTDLVQAREAAARSADRFRSIAETMPQKIFTAAPNGEVDYFNGPWTAFTGLLYEDIKAWGWTQFIHPDDVDENVRVWQHSIDSGEPFVFQHRFRRADGEYRWHLSRAHAVRDAGGAILMWIGSNTDIDDQKRAADTVRETLALRDEFLSAAAHDLKTPLTSVRGHVQLIRRRAGPGLTPSIAASLDEVERAATSMAGLIDELLEIARIEAGHSIVLNLREIDLVALVNAVAKSAVAQSRRHDVLVEADPPSVLGRWDPVRLERSLMNLVSNAIKYTPSGGTITLSTRVEQTAAQKLAIVRVKDEGIGIPEADLPRLFTRFQRGSNVRGVAGTGIGLEAVRRIVELHGGSIRVESREGVGSTFTVRLPIL
ncbi:MAG: ATP-binding protein [Chloroflexota bacterium]|nr:ATP-binding protein [Chloroflexota bacterium]